MTKSIFRFRFALTFLWRNWRSGEVKILALAMVLAVAVVTAIAVFANRMEQSLIRQSSSYLAADRVIEGRSPIPEAWRIESQSYPLMQASTAEFNSMVFAADDTNGGMQLASVKAVSNHYPLRGELEISQQAFALGDQVILAEGIPRPGEVWVDSRLLPLMDLALGERLTIGERNFTITHVVIREPDSSGGFAILGPRVMMNLIDLESTGVVLPGSRVTYRWLLAGDLQIIKPFTEWLSPQLDEHYRLLSLREAQQNISAALDRGSRFLMLAGMIGVLLAGVAISIAAQQFARRHIDQVALMKSMGASAWQVRGIYFFQMLTLGLLAAVVGVLLGELIQQLITATIASFFNITLLRANFFSYVVGIMTGILCLLCFVLPPLWYLPKVPPIKVIRRELQVSRVGPWIRGLLGLVALITLIAVYSGDRLLTISVVVGLIAIIGVSALLAWLLFMMGQQLGSRAGSIWRLALANLRREKMQTITQTLVFACALMLLIVLFTVRTHLLDEWRLQLPEDAPNHFVLNVAPNEKVAVEQLFSQHYLDSSPMYPMVLGRLVGKNDYRYEDKDRSLSNVLRRELNLSWAETLAPDNQIVAGQWWDQWSPQVGDVGVSVEQETAQELGLTLGDTLHYSLGGLSLAATVTSIRTVDWNAMTPNFYFLFSPGALDAYSPNYLTSLYIPPEQKRFVNTLLKQYPTIVVFEVDRIIERIQTIVNQVSRAIELVLWLVLMGGVLVLIAAVNASMTTRRQSCGLLRALGSSQRLILGSLWWEFATLGFLAGFLAVLGAEALILSLQAWVFEQSIQPHYGLWLASPLISSLFIGSLGLWACRDVVRVAPNIVLRESEG